MGGGFIGAEGLFSDSIDPLTTWEAGRQAATMSDARERSSLKRQQDESITVTPSSSSSPSFEAPPKKAKVQASSCHN